MVGYSTILRSLQLLQNEKRKLNEAKLNNKLFTTQRLFPRVLHRPQRLKANAILCGQSLYLEDTEFNLGGDERQPWDFTACYHNQLQQIIWIINSSSSIFKPLDRDKRKKGVFISLLCLDNCSATRSDKKKKVLLVQRSQLFMYNLHTLVLAKILPEVKQLYFLYATYSPDAFV